MRQTIAESHIYVTQGVQRQGAFKKDKQYPQAIDLRLNTAMTKFIRSRIKPTPNSDRFEINESMRQDIQSLIVLNRKLKITKTDEDNVYEAVLPADFKYLLSDKSTVIEDCVTGFKTPSDTKTEKIFVIPFNDSTALAPYYKLITVKYNSNSINIDTPGFDYKQDKVYLIELILKGYKDLGIEAYWEQYRGNRRTNCFLLPTFVPADTVGLVIDNVTVTNKTPIQKTFQLMKTIEGGFKSVNRNVVNDFLNNTLDSFYSKPTSLSPISTVASNSIFIYCDKRFLPSSILIDYIRQPQPVNLSLGNGFELHEDTHDRICDLAIELSKEQIEDQSLSTTVQLNDKRNP